MTAMTKEATNKSSEPEYFSYNKIIARVPNMNKEVIPKFDTLIASIIKLNTKTPISIGIRLTKTTKTAPIKKTAGKLITVVSSIAAMMQSVVMRNAI